MPRYCFATVMSFGMTAVASAVLTAVNVGFGRKFLLAWLVSFSLGFVVSMPAALASVPVVRTLVDRIVEHERVAVTHRLPGLSPRCE